MNDVYTTVLADNRREGHGICTWLFNPFHYVAGGTALGIGLAIILLTGYLGSLIQGHFDGVLDFHISVSGPMWLYLAAGIVNWLVMAVLLTLVGLPMSRGRARIVDIAGTQALARGPMFLVALLALMPGFSRALTNLEKLSVSGAKDNAASSLLQGLSALDVLGFTVTVIGTILAIVWAIVLMYRAFAVSCNLRGPKAIGTFAVTLLIGEIVSKIAFFAMMTMAGLSITGTARGEVPVAGSEPDNRIVDNIDLPFVDDPSVLGTWQSVDFVDTTDQFDPAVRRWQGDLYLKELSFFEGGRTQNNWQTWTKGFVLHSGDKTASAYEIRTIDGTDYMFFEWKSGDYTIRHMKPKYYVLKRK